LWDQNFLKKSIKALAELRYFLEYMSLVDFASTQFLDQRFMPFCMQVHWSNSFNKYIKLSK
jgi:hypothetical protein